MEVTVAPPQRSRSGNMLVGQAQKYLFQDVDRKLNQMYKTSHRPRDGTKTCRDKNSPQVNSMGDTQTTGTAEAPKNALTTHLELSSDVDDQ